MLPQPVFPGMTPGHLLLLASGLPIDPSMTPSASRHLPAFAQWLGYAGLIPFVVLAAMMWWLPATNRMAAALALTAYGATITSFLGAIHWGLVMRGQTERNPTSHFVWGVVPSLLAWIALLLAPSAGLVLLAVVLALCFAVDRATYAQFGLEHWLRLRLHLSLVAGASCLVAAASLVR